LSPGDDVRGEDRQAGQEHPLLRLLPLRKPRRPGHHRHESRRVDKPHQRRRHHRCCADQRPEDRHV